MIKYFLIALTLSAAILPLKAQWTTLQLSAGRSEMAGAYVQGKVLFAGGYTKTGSHPEVTAAVDIYDTATHIWSVAQLSSPRVFTATVVLDTKVLFVGGLTPDAGGDLVSATAIDVYDAATGIWSQESLPEPRFGLRGVVVGNKAYFVSEDGPLEDVVVYDGATQAWSELPLPGGPRRGVSIGARGAKLFIAGGVETFGAEVKTINIYDTATGAWSTNQLLNAREGVEVAVVNELVFFIGGQKGISAADDFDVYNAVTGEMINGSSAFSHYQHAVGTYAGSVYIGGSGSISANTANVEIFNTAILNFHPPFTLSYPGNVPHWKQTAVSTPQGVFFAGGETNAADFVDDKVFVFPAISATHQPETHTLRIQPSLVTDHLEIAWPEPGSSTDTLIEILDMEGRTQQIIRAPGGDGVHSISVTGLPAGHYTLRLTTKKGIWIGRFVKQ